MLGAILSLAPSLATAQDTATLTTIHQFDSTDGALPTSLVQGSDGNLYGTTQSYNGIGGEGTVFQFTRAGVLTTLYRFTGGADGVNPSGLIQGSDGNFYGVTGGGADAAGTIFRITPAGVFTTFYTFTGGSDGVGPGALVQGSDGNFYGTTTLGGAAVTRPNPPGFGTVFQLTPAGVLTTLHTFDGTDGESPGLLLEGIDGNFYGTTNGGGANGVGSVFQITPAGVFTTLYNFVALATTNPVVTGLTQDNFGNFYGTATPGSDDSGSIFEVTPDGTFTIIHHFNGNDGSTPSELLLASDGNFYGTTKAGGPGYEGTALGGGTVFQLTPAGGFTTLYCFSGTASATAANLLQAKDGTLYGYTDGTGGGPNPYGSVFQVLVASHPAFFTGTTALLDDVSYLAFPNGNYFGYFAFLADPLYLYHFDLGYEYVIDAQDYDSGIYLYDFASKDFFYTSPDFGFPFLYDFNLDSIVYYFPDPNNPGHYNIEGTRYFYVYSTGQIISK